MVKRGGFHPLLVRSLVLILLVVLTPIFVAQPAPAVFAQDDGTPPSISCEPTPPPEAPELDTANGQPAAPVAEVPNDALEVTMGYVPVSIFAPVFVALEKGYYAEQGLDVTLEPLPGGSDMIVLTGTGRFDLGIGGVGPAFWNAMAVDLPLTVIAPGHAEGSPVATPLMIPTDMCLSGEITSVADLAGKRVAVNARGATEYWLSQALATGGLTLDDIQLQTLAFPDAVAALASGALDASMVGEPLAALAERDGIAIRLATDFPVQDVQPTLIYANDSFLNDNPEAVQGLVTAYLKASRDLSGDGFFDPNHLAIIQEYTGVPATLVASAVQPVFPVDGEINLDGLNQMQSFFRERDQLDYDTDLDPSTFVNDQFVNAALDELGPYQGDG